MKNLLIITYHFPPCPSIGAVRLEGLANYLPQFGWEPVIITPAFPGGPDKRFQVVQTEYVNNFNRFRQLFKFNANQKVDVNEFKNHSPSVSARKKLLIKKKISTIMKAFLCYPDENSGWIPYALNVAKKLLKEKKFAAILTSSKPETTHLIGALLKREFSLPWLADFRDLWTQNHYYEFCKTRKVMEQRLEIRTLQWADALVTVSEPLAAILHKLHQNKKVYSVPNGFDPVILAPNNVKLSNDFTISYTGILYEGKRDPTLLFIALNQLIKDGVIDQNRIKVNFYGDQDYTALNLACEYGLREIVHFMSRVSREEALTIQRESQVLLLINRNASEEAGVYTGKIFEYLAAKRPILAIGGPPGVVSELLKTTGTGIHQTSLEGIKNILSKWWQDFLVTGRVPYEGKEEAIMEYSHVKMAERFAIILNELIKLYHQEP